MAQVRYHRKKDGTPGECKAKPGNCPLGGIGEHFISKDEAQKFCDKVNEEEALANSELTLFFNPTEEKGTESVSLEDLYFSDSRFSRLEAIRNGYIPNTSVVHDESQAVQEEAIKNGIYLDKFAQKTSDNYIRKLARDEIRKSINPKMSAEDFDFEFRLKSGDFSKELVQDKYTDEFKMTKDKLRALKEYYQVNFSDDLVDKDVIFMRGRDGAEEVIESNASEFIPLLSQDYREDFVEEFELEIEEMILEEEAEGGGFGIKGKSYDGVSGILERMDDDPNLREAVSDLLEERINNGDTETANKTLSILLRNGLFEKHLTKIGDIYVDRSI